MSETVGTELIKMPKHERDLLRSSGLYGIEGALKAADVRARRSRVLRSVTGDIRVENEYLQAVATNETLQGAAHDVGTLRDELDKRVATITKQKQEIDQLRQEITILRERLAVVTAEPALAVFAED